MRRLYIILPFWLLGGCSSRVIDTLAEGVADETGAGEPDPEPEPQPQPQPHPPDEPPEDSTGGGDDDDGGSDFLPAMDIPVSIPMCDFWAEQPCPAGEKCQSIASTPGSGTWDATICVPHGIDAVGEACCIAGVGDCLIEGPAGTDSCDETSICLDVDQDTLLGTCTEYCVGPENAPSCPQTLGACWKINAPIALCLPWCDPLTPGECPEGQTCVAGFETGGDLTGFTCFAPGTAEPGAHGDACECANCCQQGFKCEEAAVVGQDCEADFCCTELCDVTDSGATCEGGDQSCTPLFDENDPIYGNVGQCQVPE